ncbi:MAG: class I SAM-dependent methyltransferase [Proteobacteria bacterium]|nr:class I SAM-dependent methyltransferase [Pseudomonadota bacterium]
MMSIKKTTIVALTIVSAAVLAYELTQIRIFAYSLHTVIAYSAIALAMLGFGLGATLLVLRPSWAKADLERLLAFLCMGLAVSIIGVNILFAHTSSRTTTIDTVEINRLWCTIVFLPCIIPYFLAGMITTLIFQAGMSRIGRIYFWNLLGSAMGCTGMILLLRPLGAERLLVLTAALSATASVVLMISRGSAIRWVGMALTAALLVCWPFAQKLFPFQSDINGYNAVFDRREKPAGFVPPVLELTEWDPIGRIDIQRISEKNDYRVVTIDGGAMTLMLEEKDTAGWGRPLFADSMYGTAYYLKKHPKVLVIGSGGGTDIQTALHWNAKSVTGVEISYSTLRAVTGRYADYVGWPKRDNVKAFHSDGRSFAKSTDSRFDIIQMSGVDTMTMHTSGGAMVAAEDYLYTVEAFMDFLSILEPGGILSVIRFGEQNLKLSAIAVESLRRLGIPHPERRIVALRQTNLSGILVKKEPFGEKEIDTLRQFASREKESCVAIPHYDFAGVQLSALIEILHPSSGSGAYVHETFFDWVKKGKSLEEITMIGPELDPPTDDRPYYILKELLGALRRGENPHPALALLIVSTAIIGLASLLLVFLPALSVYRRASAGVGNLMGVILYFFGIGAGFMLLEVGLIHRATVFVATPGAAVAVVISALLVFSGVGSRISDLINFPLTGRIAVAYFGLLVLSILYRYGVEPLFDLLFGLPVWVRCIAAALTIAPAGFFMGWFFPIGLQVAKSISDSLVPWAIAVNGFASVIGTLSTLFIGVMFGFSGVFLISLICYTAAAVVLLPLTRRIRKAH